MFEVDSQILLPTGAGCGMQCCWLKELGPATHFLAPSFGPGKVTADIRGVEEWIGAFSVTICLCLK